MLIVVDRLRPVASASWLVADDHHARRPEPDALQAADQGREGSKRDRGQADISRYT
ncbi:hypothetical protein [Polymorphospora rubra]|uniref:hypothetical protein n=1 Tax=Polymorphospora rubra TaxID=338584 RepID=UPI0033FF7FFD